MSTQEAMEDGVLDSFEKMGSKKETVTCFGSSSCIPLVDFNEGNGKWFCSNILDPIMEFTLKLYIYKGKNDEEKDNAITQPSMTAASDDNSIIEDSNDAKKQ